MLKIRLQRTGRRNDPSFRMVVTEHTRGTTSQKHVDRVGFYNPKTKEKSLDTERITHWIGVGAKPSGTVHNMLIKEGIIKGDTINVLPQKSPVKKEELKEASGEPQVASSGDGAAAEESGENKPPTEGAEAPKAQADQPAAEKKEEPEQNKEELKQESEEAPAQEADGTEEKKVA